MRSLVAYVLAFIALVSVLDITVTMATREVVLDVEMNPLARAVMEYIGVSAFCVLKAASNAAIIAILFVMRNHRLFPAILFGVAAAQAAVVGFLLL